LHIGPLGICSRFADRGLSVFVIESLKKEFFSRLIFSSPGARRRVGVFLTVSALLPIVLKKSFWVTSKIF